MLTCIIERFGMGETKSRQSKKQSENENPLAGNILITALSRIPGREVQDM